MNRLTTEQLEAIRKRAEAATEGPWKYNEEYDYLAPVTPQRQIAAICNIITREEDADFIAHAREDIPALLAEIERLRKENVMYEQAIAEDDATKERLIAKLDDAISISLWATRRLHNRQHKDFAYDAIERNLGREVERV